MSKILGNTTMTPVPRSDWAQNDETKADYVKNRTHYEGWVEFLPETIATFNSDYEFAVYEGSFPHVFKDKQQYRFFINGTEKIFTAWFSEDNGMVVIADDDGTIEACSIDNGDGTYSGMIGFLTCQEDVTFKIEEYSIKQLDPKFVPNLPYKELQTVFPETTLEWNEDVEGFIAATDFVLEVGKTYTVTHNGVEYSCTTEKFQGIPLIGDFNAITTGTPSGSFPFVIITMENAIALMPLNSDETHTIKIDEEVYHQIDPRFVPNLPYEETFEPLLDKTYEITENVGIISEEYFEPLLIEGEKYIITWDGKQYTCTAVYNEMEGMGATAMITLGDSLPIGKDSFKEYPFIIGVMFGTDGSFDDKALIIWHQKKSGDVVTVKVEKESIIHQLDPKFVPNLPYSEFKETTILEEQTVPFVTDYEGWFTDQCAEISVGDILTVKYEGVEYETKAFGYEGFTVFGNPYCVDSGYEDNGLPFCGGYSLDMFGGLILLPMDESFYESLADLTLGIVAKKELVHQIDPKFVPNLPYVEADSVYLEEQTLSDPNENFLVNVPEMVVGATYIVSFNGIEYERVAKDFMGMVTYIGNYRAFDENDESDDTPFTFIYAEGTITPFTFNDETEITFSVIQKGIVHQIDPKFVPNLPYEDWEVWFPRTQDGDIFDDEYESYTDHGGCVYSPEIITKPFVVGRRYKIVIDDVHEYILTAHFDEDEGGVILYQEFDNEHYIYLLIVETPEGYWGQDWQWFIPNQKEVSSLEIFEENIHQLDPKFVPNLPYTEEIEEVLIEEAVYPYSEDEGGITFFDKAFIAGDTYIVRWNDVEYECVPFEVVTEEMAVICIGNPAFTGGDDNGMPFSAVDMGGIIGFLTEEDTKIGVVHKYTKYHQIDPRLVPNLPWKETKSETYIEEAVYPYDEEMSGFIFADAPTLIENDIYKVKWGDTEYQCDAFILMNLACIGNPSFVGIGEDNGLPFFGAYEPDGGLMMMGAETTELNIGIIHEIVEYHQIDPKFVPNLPYEEMAENILIPDGIEITTTQSGDFAMFMAETPLALVAGYTYKVFFDGVVYECVPREVSAGTAVIGNSTLAPLWETNSEGNGEPFYIIPFNSEGFGLITSTAGTYYIGITEYKSEIHKLDEKFIPDSIARVDDIPKISEIPTTLPNPNALTFTGAVTGSYDGTSAKTINIPTTLPNPNALTFTGAVTGSYDGTSAKTINIPESLQSLPNVSSSDNGAFLRVVDGVWAKVKLLNAEEGEF